MTNYFTDYRAHNELVRLRKRVEAFESGEIYEKITGEYEMKLAKKERELERFRTKCSRQEEECRLLQLQNKDLTSQLFRRECDISRLESWIRDRDERISELEKKNAEMKDDIDRMRSLLNTDGTNSGTPTSRTPLSKEKIRPNSRVRTGRKAGGQNGHPRHTLTAHTEDQITERAIHEYSGSCPVCDAVLEDTGETIDKDETEIRVKVCRIRHQFKVYSCPCCGKQVHMRIPNRLKEENQYGTGVQALVLSLMNTGNVPINKVSRIVSGMTDEGIRLSEGYIAKIQKRSADGLCAFREDLRKLLLDQPVVYWDDTVVMIDRKRACMRFYGNDRIAWYAAHMRKDLEGIRQDQILQNLREQTYVMHDHNTVNYSKEFCYRNLECNVHLLRDLERICQILDHDWASALKDMIREKIHLRKDRVLQGDDSFTPEEVREFRRQLEEVLDQADQQNKKDYDRYYGQEEKALIRRIRKYQENYFMWITDFHLPISDNLSERNLRCIKSKMKISGQFKNEMTADHYAAIRTYIETCRKNEINEIEALQRLVSGEPYTVREIFRLSSI